MTNNSKTATGRPRRGVGWRVIKAHDCERCGARPGRLCRTANGKPTENIHLPRWRAYQRACASTPSPGG